VWTGSTWFTRGDRGNDFEFRTYSLVNLSTPTDIALDSNSVDENMLAGTTVGGFSTTDADSGDSFSYSLVSGVGSDENAAFSLDDDGVLKTAASFDHEAKSFYRIRVRATDAGGLTCEKVFQIDIRNVNEPPSDITMHKDWVDENQPEGAHVGWFETIDPDNGESFACSLVSGDGDTDNALFTLEEYGDLYTAAVFNYETKDSYSIRVRSTEADGFSVEKAFTITVNDVNDPPVLAAIGNKSGPFGDTITFTASATDEDGDAITYSLVGSPVGSLDPTSGAYTWTPGPTAIGAHSFVVIASDGHVADAESITITATTRTATITACDVQSAVLNSPVKLSGLLSDSGGLTSLLANAKLTVKLTPIAGGTTITLPDIGVDAGGKFSATFATPTPIPLGSYEVCLVIGDRYIGTASWYDALAVYDPAAGFASGGGWFLWPGTTQKTTFGFVTNYMKNRSNFKGNLVMVRHLPDGTIYRVKSNAVSGLSLSSPTKVGGWVSFNGKANYMDPTMSSWLGGYTFNMYAEDNNQPGTGIDKFWLQLMYNGAIVGDCSMAGASGGGAVPAVPLGGGNVLVPHK
jgi:hypothetical protein